MWFQKVCIKLFLPLLLLSLSACSYVLDKNNAGEPETLSAIEKSQLSYQTIHTALFKPKCLECHSAGDKLSLDSHEDVVANLNDIKRTVLETKTMPKGDTITPRQEAMLRAWIEMGAPKEGSHDEGEMEPTPSPTPEPEPPRKPPGSISYEDVRTGVFATSCVRCHSVKNPEGGVKLDSYAEVKRNLAEVIKSALIEKSMPKNKELSKNQYELLLNWIGSGAPEKAEGRPDPAPTPSPAPTPPLPPLEATYESIRRNIIVERCLDCHSADGRAEHIPLGTYEDLIDSPREIVIPENPDESGMIIFLERTDDKRMPPERTGPPLKKEEIAKIREWIQNGAKQ